MAAKERNYVSEGSYQVQDISKNINVELNRLKAQVSLFWYKEKQRYVGFGLKDGMSIVEFGSGPGFLSIKLLESFPNATITAVEIDPFLADIARKNLAEKGLKNCTVVNGSIMKTGFKDNVFDFAITRLVMEHLPDPLQASKEIFRLLKPGGKSVLIDNDFESHLKTFPHVPKLRDMYDAFCKSQFDKGGNPKIGRELPKILKKSGFGDIDFEIIGIHSDIVGLEIFSNSEGVGIPIKLVKEGYLPSKVLGSLSVDWRNMTDHEDSMIMRQLSLAVGTKKMAEH